MKQEIIYVMPMQRNEAVTYLKELLAVCNEMSPQVVSFENPKNSATVGYIVHIKGEIHDSDKQAVRDVARRQRLAVKEDISEVVVYKPQ